MKKQELKGWRKNAYEKWSENRFKTEWSNNPIKRFKYCLHEWRWNAFHSQITWFSNTYHWFKIYLGVLR